MLDRCGLMEFASNLHSKVKRDVSEGVESAGGGRGRLTSSVRLWLWRMDLRLMLRMRQSAVPLLALLLWSTWLKKGGSGGVVESVVLQKGTRERDPGSGPDVRNGISSNATRIF